MVCSDHPENASSEKAVLAAQQNLLNTFADFLIYISFVTSSVWHQGLVADMSWRCPSLSLPNDIVPKRLAYDKQLSHR